MRGAGAAFGALLVWYLLAGSALAQSNYGGDPDQGLTCGLDLGSVGVVPRQIMPRPAPPSDDQGYDLRVLTLRFPAEPDDTAEGGAALPFAVMVREVVLLYHLPTQMIANELAAHRASLVAAYGPPLAETMCSPDTTGDLTLYDPFIQIDTQGRAIIERKIVVAARDVEVTEFPFPLLPFDMASIAKPPVVWVRNSYAWITDLDFAAPAPDVPVFAVDRVTCEARGIFIIGSLGHTAAYPPDDPMIPVVRDSMIAANVYFGAGGDPLDAATVSASVDPNAYWCIPKKEICYEKIPFGDFGVDAQPGKATPFAPKDVISLRHGFESALLKTVMSNCEPEPMEAK